MTLNDTLKTLKKQHPGLQYCYLKTHKNPKLRQSVIIRIPDGKHQDAICETLKTTLWDNLKIPYYWQPRKKCIFCHVVPHFYTA
jgi:hypothetical protein